MDSDVVMTAVSTILGGLLTALAAWWLRRPKPPMTFLLKAEQLDRVLTAAPDRSKLMNLERYRDNLLAEAEVWAHPRSLRWRQVALALPSGLAGIGVGAAFFIGGLSHSVAVAFPIVMLTFAISVIVWLFVAGWSSWVSVAVEAEVRRRHRAKPSPLQLP